MAGVMDTVGETMVVVVMAVVEVPAVVENAAVVVAMVAMVAVLGTGCAKRRRTRRIGNSAPCLLHCKQGLRTGRWTSSSVRRNSSARWLSLCIQVGRCPCCTRAALGAAAVACVGIQRALAVGTMVAVGRVE